MFIDVNSIQIKRPSDSNYVNLGNYDGNGTSLITEARYSYNKIWADDSGRNLAGTMSGTLIGIFPKIIVNFKKLSKSELELITPILDSSRQIVRYYDPTKKVYVTMTTYTGDYEVINKKIITNEIKSNGKWTGAHKNETFEVSFIAVSKRT